MTVSLLHGHLESPTTLTPVQQQPQADDDAENVEMMEAVQDTKTTDTGLTGSSSGIKKMATTNRQVMKKKSVGWNEDVTMRLSLHVNEYTDDEFFGTWYQPHEFDQMKRSAMKEQCPIRLRRKIMVRHAVTDALLNEQYRQYHQRQYNDDITVSQSANCHDNDDNALALAAVCRMASVRAHREAKVKAAALCACLECR